MAKAAYVSYIAVVIHLLLLLRIVTANQPVVPFPRGASGPNPSRIPASSDTGEASSVKLTTTYVEAVVKTATPTPTPTEDPSEEASTDTALRPSHDKFARNNLTGFFSALRGNLVSNFHSHLIALLPPFSHLHLHHLHPRERPPPPKFLPSISRLAQIPKSLAHHVAMKPPSVMMQRYGVSAYAFLTDSIAAVKSAVARALCRWDMRVDRSAAAYGWADSLPSPYPLTPPPSQQLPSSVRRSSPETAGLLSIRQTDVALLREEEYSSCAHVGRTVQRTAVLAGWIVLREVRKWEGAGKAVMRDAAQLRRRVWACLVVLSIVCLAFLTALLLLGLVWGLTLWFRAAVWLLRRIRG